MKQAMTVTEPAAARIKTLMARAPEGMLGLRVGVKARGCSGLAYTIDYAAASKKFEDSIEQDGIKIFIDPPATMFLIGTEMDFEDSPLESKFIFRNPNERGRCGCGESFTVDAEKAAIAAGTLEKDENDNCGS